jgi:hypothetical protein
MGCDAMSQPAYKTIDTMARIRYAIGMMARIRYGIDMTGYGYGYAMTGYGYG